MSSAPSGFSPAHPLSPTQYASQRGFRNAQLPRGAQEALAREQREKETREPSFVDAAAPGVQDDARPAGGGRGPSLELARAPSQREGLAEQASPTSVGRSPSLMSNGQSRRSDSLKRSRPSTDAPRSSTPSGLLAPPLGPGPTPTPYDAHPTSHEPLESAHTHAGQDVHVPPSLGGSSAPVSAAASAERAGASWEDPLAPGERGAGAEDGGGHVGTGGKERSRYTVASPKIHVRTMSEEQSGEGFHPMPPASAAQDEEASPSPRDGYNSFSDLHRQGSVRSNPFTDKKSPAYSTAHKAQPDRDASHRHSSTSAAASTAAAPRQRNYHRLRQQPLQDTHYLLGGRLVTGGDSPLPFLLSVVLVLGLGGLWLGATGVWMWREGLGGSAQRGAAGGKATVVVFAYLLGIVVSSMLATALRDPGIIPRNLDLYPPTSRTVSTGSLTPLTREVRVRNGTVTIKYCETCKVYRPPRSSHCRLCGNCVEGIDHHCTYLHACVGRRNYTSFITFLVSATLAAIYTVVFSALHFSILCSREKISFRQALSRSPASAVSFALGVILVFPVMALLGYHLRLMFFHSTTIEQIRSSASKSLMPTSRPQANPFSYGSFWRNVAHSLCRPQFATWIDPHGLVEEDTRQPNPGEKGQFGIASKVDVRNSGTTSRFGGSIRA